MSLKIKNLTKSEIKNRLFQMGMSLDKEEHPKGYYVKLFLEKYNAKHKVTRNNTPFYSEPTQPLLKAKRRRNTKIKQKKQRNKTISAQKKKIDKKNDVNIIIKNKINKKINCRNNKNIEPVKEDKNNDYKKTGIKIIRLIPIKLNQNEHIDEQNFNEMENNNKDNSNDSNQKIIILDEKENQNINNSQDEINECSNQKNTNIILTVKEPKDENKDENNEKKDNNKNNNIFQDSVITFKAPNDQSIENYQFLSKGPISFGCVTEPRPEDAQTNEAPIDNSNSQKMNFILTGMNDSNKKILLHWDSPSQKEFLCSSMEKPKDTIKESFNLNDKAEINSDPKLQKFFMENDDISEPKEEHFEGEPINDDNINQKEKLKSKNLNINPDIKEEIINKNNDNNNSSEEINLKDSSDNIEKNSLNNDIGNNQYENTFPNMDSHNIKLKRANKINEEKYDQIFNLTNNNNRRKNNILNKCKKYIYLWPILFLLIFGIIFIFWYNNDNRNEEEYPIQRYFIISLGLIMALIILYHLFKYIKESKRYKKMAKEDKEQLIKYFEEKKINSENLQNNFVSLNNFIISRITYHNITSDEYINCVFPYLQKLLKSLGFVLKKDENNDFINNKDYLLEL